ALLVCRTQSWPFRPSLVEIFAAPRCKPIEVPEHPMADARLAIAAFPDDGDGGHLLLLPPGNADRKEAHIALRQALAQAMSSQRVALEFHHTSPARLPIRRHRALQSWPIRFSYSWRLGLGVESTHRRFERCSRGSAAAHTRAAQELGRTLFTASRRRKDASG